ncbi:MAG: flagellar hook-length control protein FliK [Treponema sp.]|nr:flagellar hook-length control protein FliK [Treponema sp.]
MIAVSTYTEPVPVNPLANEPLQTQETEEKEESGEFAEILAGLLRTNEMIQTDQNVELSELESVFTVSTMEETETAGETDLFEIAGKAQEINIDFSGIEISDKYMNDLSEIENFGQVTDITDGLIPDVSNVKTETLAELKLKNDFAQSVSVSQSDLENAALEVSVNEEFLSADAVRKKEKSFLERSLSENEKKDALTQNLKNINETDALRKTSDNESRGRLDEIRNRSRRETRSANGVSIEVRDFRTAETSGMNNPQKPFSVLEASAGRAQNETPVREITLELRLPEQNNSAPQTTWEAKAGTALENMLARELHQNFNGDIVRHASMALRDGGEGTIRIALKPESLGNVKIRLEMSENKITGIIFVESEESLNAFRREITSLEQAFRDSGFTNADLNLTLTQDGQNQQEWNREANSFTSQMAASRYEDSFDDAPLVNIVIGRQQGSINMLA